MNDPLAKKLQEINARYAKLWDNLSERQASVAMFEAIEKNKQEDIQKARAEYEYRRLRTPQVLPPPMASE